MPRPRAHHLEGGIGGTGGTTVTAGEARTPASSSRRRLRGQLSVPAAQQRKLLGQGSRRRRKRRTTYPKVVKLVKSAALQSTPRASRSPISPRSPLCSPPFLLPQPPSSQHLLLCIQVVGIPPEVTKVSGNRQKLTFQI